ncbi:MAG: type 4a pilus biogenesis protein PilO [Deltaproteobacteria bacterium]|nr:MAG: type 4a pilus biogenesis protein PilO [Deltaproteobacteria bacterium]
MDFGLDKLDPALEKFAKLPKPYRMALVPALVVALFGLYYLLLYGGASTQLEVLESQRDKKQRKLNEARSAASNVGPFEEELSRLQDQLERALLQLPDRKELPVLLVDISTLGKNSGLEVSAFRPMRERNAGFYAEVPIQLEFSGKYHDIAKFFDRVSKLPRIVNVGNLDMSVRSAKGEETVLKVTGTATTFRFIENENG